MISLVQPSKLFLIIVFEPGDMDRGVSPGRPICGTPPIDGLVYWGLLEGPGGSRKERRKEVGERYPGGVFIRKCLNAKSHHRVDRYWYYRLGWGFWRRTVRRTSDGLVTGWL